MDIIPVIDLLDGQVVHARLGQRSKYRPIQSQVCNGSEALDIIEALLGLHAFKKLYIADLNAIQRNGNHAGLIRKIRDIYPQLEIWVDAGFTKLTDLRPWQELQVHPVLGSENLASLEDYLAIRSSQKNNSLSLDFHPDGYKGPTELLQESDLWPDKLILMTLNRVGSGQGPDMEKLQTFVDLGRTVKPEAAIYAAGGIRHISDIAALKNIGVAGALLASALHQGQIVADELAAMTI